MKDTRRTAVELAAINKHHVAGTAYHWWHLYKPRDVATALMWGKKEQAKKLHAQAAGHFNVEPASWWQKHPTLKKTLPANAALGGITPVSHAKPPKAGKLSKAGKLVIQAPVGSHKVGDKVSVTHPKTGDTAPHEVTSVGKVFQVKGQDQQYHYVAPVGGPTKSPEPPKAEVPSGPKPVVADIMGVGAADSQAQKLAASTGKPHWVTPSDVGKGYDVFDTNPGFGSMKFNPSDVSKGAGMGAPAKAKPGLKAFPSENAALQSADFDAADSGQPMYVTPVAGGGFLSSPKIPPGLKDYKMVHPSGDVATVKNGAIVPKGEPVHPENKAGVSELGSMDDLPHDTGDPFVTRAAALQKAIKTGQPQYVDTPGTPQVLDSKPTTGPHLQMDPNGDVTKFDYAGSAGKKLSPKANAYAAIAKDEQVHAPPEPKGLVNGSGDAPDATLMELIADTSAYGLKPVYLHEDPSKPSGFGIAYLEPKGAYLVATPDGKIHDHLGKEVTAPGAKAPEPAAPAVPVAPKSLYPTGPIDSLDKLVAAAKHGKTFPKKTQAEKQSTAFQQAVKTGQTQYMDPYTGYVGPNQPTDPMGSYGEFTPDGKVITHQLDGSTAILADDKVVTVVGQFAKPKPAKVPGKNPPTKAATGMGPTSKALYNAPDITLTNNMEITKAAALQKAIKTGQPQYVMSGGFFSDKKPVGMGHLAFYPDGGASSHSAYGGGTKFKPSQVKATALLGLKGDNSSAPKVSSDQFIAADAALHGQGQSLSGPLPGVPGIPSGEEKAFVNTPSGDYLAKHQPNLPDDAAVAQDYKTTVKLNGKEKHALTDYTGSGYGSLNRVLRGGEPVPSYLQGSMDGLDSAMAKYSTPTAILVKRGFSPSPGEFPTGNLAGKVYQDAGYGSTAIGGGFGGSVRMRVLLPKGTHGVSVLGAGGGAQGGTEQEFILPRGTQYFIEKDEKVGGTRYITATVIPTPQHTSTPVKKHGVISDAAHPVSKGAYSSDGLAYLHLYGKAAWLQKYAKTYGT